MSNLAKRAEETHLQEANPQGGIHALLESQWPKIRAVMPEHMSSERLFQLSVSAINQTPKLAECTPVSLLSCVMKCSALGLEPSAVDGLGRAYILPFFNKKTRAMEATLIVGYKGMVDLARRSGELKSIHAQAVYEGDTFKHWEDETGQHFKFDSKRDAVHSPEKLTDVYVCAQLMGGGFVFETMTKAEVEAIRERSRSKDFGPWKTDYEAMALKTVIRRSFRYLPVSTQAKTAAAADETTPDYRNVFKPVIHDSTELPDAEEPEEVPAEAVEPSRKAVCKSCGTVIEHVAPDAEIGDLNASAFCCEKPDYEVSE